MSSLLAFNGVHRLEIQSVMLVFSTPLVNQRPSNPSHWFGWSTPPPLPCVNKYRGTCIHKVCYGGGEERVGLRQINTFRLPPSTFTGHFLRKAVIQTFRVRCLYNIWSMFGTYYVSYVAFCLRLRNARRSTERTSCLPCPPWALTTMSSRSRWVVHCTLSSLFC